MSRAPGLSRWLSPGPLVYAVAMRVWASAREQVGATQPSSLSSACVLRAAGGVGQIALAACRAQ
eukprot:4962947-Lingulodinium_polyedra.AAC.1